jgi:hypothetical protein
MAFLLAGCPAADRPYQLTRVEFMQACRKDTMGSGTTAIACINTDRRYIGFELDAGYYDASIDRIEGHQTPSAIMPVLDSPSASLDALF